jgi:hypothetical protein
MVFSTGSTPILYSETFQETSSQECEDTWNHRLDVRQSPAGNDMSRRGYVWIRYQATIGEDIADWEDLVCAVVICKVCELETAP